MEPRCAASLFRADKHESGDYDRCAFIGETVMMRDHAWNLANHWVGLGTVIVWT